MPRGSLIGPLIIAGAMFNEEDIPKLKNLGVKDSKLLTHKERMRLRKEIEKLAKGIKIIKIYPAEIDEAVDGNNSLNLNWLEANKIVEIITELNPDKAIIDCPSPNCKKYKEYLQSRLIHQPELIVEHKAEKYFPVGAASILAKCIREEEVEKIEKYVGESIGSGYPSNPVCQEFLKNNHNKYPEIFRKSWMTFKNHKISKLQRKLGEF